MTLQGAVYKCHDTYLLTYLLTVIVALSQLCKTATHLHFTVLSQRRGYAQFLEMRESVNLLTGSQTEMAGVVCKQTHGLAFEKHLAI